MIVLRCEMWPGGDRKRAYSLGSLLIRNTGAGDEKHGTYSAHLSGRDGSSMGTEQLNDWPRLRHHVWDLVTVLLCLMRPGTVRRYRKLWEQP